MDEPTSPPNTSNEKDPRSVIISIYKSRRPMCRHLEGPSYLGAGDNDDIKQRSPRELQK